MIVVVLIVKVIINEAIILNWNWDHVLLEELQDDTSVVSVLVILEVIVPALNRLKVFWQLLEFLFVHPIDPSFASLNLGVVFFVAEEFMEAILISLITAHDLDSVDDVVEEVVSPILLDNS